MNNAQNPTTLIAVLEATLHGVADGILVVNLDREILYMNPQFTKMWSIHPETTTSQAALKMVEPHLPDPQAFREKIDEIYADVETDSYDLVQLRDGRILERVSKPLRSQGEILGRVWTYRDITDKKKTEAALRASEHKYRDLLAAERRHIQEIRLLDQVRTAVSYELDLDVVFRTVVTAVAETYNYSLVSIYLLEDNLLTLQYQIGYERVISRIPLNQGVAGEVMRTGRPILLEDVTQHPKFLGAIDGIVSEICVPLFDNEQPVGFINVETVAEEPPLSESDLTILIALSEHISVAISRARLYTAVRQQEARYRQLFEFAPIGMGIADRDGRLVYTNQAYANTIGYSLEELQTMSLSDFTHPDDLESNFELIKQLFAGEIDSYQFEKRYVRKDGNLVDVLLTVTLMPTSADGTRYMIAQIIDLTEQKQTEDILRHAQKMESLGVMAGGVAHDFNNLLVAMLGQSSLALKKLPPDHPARRHVEKCTTAAERAADLTRQLLAYSGRGQFVIAAVDLNQLVVDNQHLFDATLPKNVHIHTNLDQTLPPIEADAGQLQQILMNLMINAAEAMDDQPGTITITTQIETIAEEDKETEYHMGTSLPAGKYAALHIQDNGSGMDEETLTRIFDPFFTTKFTGRGLGLAAVLGIVRGHKGGLYVQSTPGIGTTFKILFPL